MVVVAVAVLTDDGMVVTGDDNDSVLACMTVVLCIGNFFIPNVPWNVGLTDRILLDS